MPPPENGNSTGLRIAALVILAIAALSLAGLGVISSLHNPGQSIVAFTLFGQTFRSNSVSLAAIFMSVVLFVILFKEIVTTKESGKTWFSSNKISSSTTSGNASPLLVKGDYQYGETGNGSSADRSPTSVIQALNVKDAKTFGDNSPLVVMGDYRVEITQQIREESRVKAKKRWKEIGSAVFPGMSLSPAIHANFFQMMLIALHREFHAEAFVRFVSVIYTRQEVRNGQTINLFQVICPHDQFCNQLQTMGRKMIEQTMALEGLSPDERQARIITLKDETIKEIHHLDQEFGLYYPQTHFSAEPTAYQCTYQRTSKRIEIKALKQSTDWSTYDDGLETTDGVLRFIASAASAHFLHIDMDAFPSGASKFRLLMATLDKTLDFDKLRISVDDPEEWDFKNDSFDREARLNE